MAHGPHVVDVDDATFEAVVLKGSATQPVVVDFWAPWCGPCLMLGPILEKVVAEQNGSLLLAKVNTDENQALARRYDVRGIPAVKAFRDGAVVSEFTGAIPEPTVRAFVTNLLGSPVAPEVARAAQLAAAGDFTGARELLDALPATDPNRPAADRLLALIALHEEAVAAGDWSELAHRVAVDPSDSAAVLGLATYEIISGAFDAGLERLVAVVAARSPAAEDARRLALLAFAAGDDPDAVRAWQGRLSAALY